MTKKQHKALYTLLIVFVGLFLGTTIHLLFMNYISAAAIAVGMSAMLIGVLKLISDDHPLEDEE